MIKHKRRFNKKVKLSKEARRTKWAPVWVVIKKLGKGKKNSCLNELRYEYNKISSKYNLPEFSELNKYFDIEDVVADTEFLLRRIRRAISERIASYSRFMEVIINPSNAPMFFYKLIKKLDSIDKESVSEMYERIGKLEVDSILLDLEYSEEKESEFITKVYEMFVKDIKVKFEIIVHKLSNGHGKHVIESNGSYFG